MLEARVLNGVGALPQGAWQRFFDGEPECWAYHRVAEQCPPDGFKLGAVGVYDGARPVAAAPVFRVDYRLDTALQGGLRRMSDWIYRRIPGLVSLPVLCLGSPLTDLCRIGIDPDLDVSERRRALGALLDGLERAAATDHVGLVALKNVADSEAEWAHAGLTAAGFTRITSVPVAYLDITHGDLNSYIRAQDAATAAYFRRKLRALSKLRIEYRRSIDGLEDQVNALYAQTRSQSSVDYGDFDALHPDYFRTVIEQLGDRARLMLAWHDGQLVSFQLFLRGSGEVVAKYIGMHYPLARELNAYFINWFMLIKFAMDHDIPRVQMGTTAYRAKVLLGARLERTWMYFRHRRRVPNGMLKVLAPLGDFERHDPELKALRLGGRPVRGMPTAVDALRV
ncbi:MAG: GNAT family N-acetyltransferase [Hyphomicrobiaceae bacterium]